MCEIMTTVTVLNRHFALTHHLNVWAMDGLRISGQVRSAKLQASFQLGPLIDLSLRVEKLRLIILKISVSPCVGDPSASVSRYCSFLVSGCGILHTGWISGRLLCRAFSRPNLRCYVDSFLTGLTVEGGPMTEQRRIRIRSPQGW